MAEDNKKTEKLTFDKAASSLKKLSDAVKECKEQLQKGSLILLQQ